MPDVFIKASRRRVVIAGTDMAITPDAVALLADYKGVLACVLRPIRPYTTCTPACSSALAQPILAASSPRAFSSTSAATCLPLSAARIRALTTGLSPDVLYRVCFIASTPGVARRLLDERLGGHREALIRMVHENVFARNGGEYVDSAVVRGR